MSTNYGDWRDDFLESLRRSPNVSRASKAAGVDRKTAYNARAAQDQFRADWEDAIANSVDRLEAAAFRRATKVSDTLAIFLLKCHRPEVYNRPTEQKVTITTLDVDITPPALEAPADQAEDGDPPAMGVLEQP